jgi:hypothetical protein
MGRSSLEQQHTFTFTLENTTGTQAFHGQKFDTVLHRQTDVVHKRLTQQRITPLALFKYRLQRATFTYEIFLQILFLPLNNKMHHHYNI